MNEIQYVDRSETPVTARRYGKWIGGLRKARDEGSVAKINVVGNERSNSLRTVAYVVAKETGVAAHTSRQGDYLLIWFDKLEAK